uniref:E3 ubiquitin-protein ligase n=1 Tax=Haptolina brevifila TaxID=156173 RepID=A0A7S2GY09_9EUKA
MTDIAVLLLSAMPPSSPSAARDLFSMLAFAVVAQECLRTCQPHAVSSAAASSASASASTDPPSVDGIAQEGGADEDAADEEALVALRAQLAEEARVAVDDAAPNGTALRAAVVTASRRFAFVGALYIEALATPFEPGAAEALVAPLPLPSAANLLASPHALRLIKAWAASLTHSLPSGVQPSVPRLLPPRPSLPTLQLQEMPRDFASLTALLHNRTCHACHERPHEPALCLLCGALLCAGNTCRRQREADEGVHGEVEPGECTRHARSCGLGVGIFALVHQCVTLLVDDWRSTYHASLYLDAHNEEDRNLRRGKPLFLNQPRQAALHRLWLAQAVPLEVARSRAASTSVIRPNYY